jgi:hypothetical protein
MITKLKTLATIIALAFIANIAVMLGITLVVIGNRL